MKRLQNPRSWANTREYIKALKRCKTERRRAGPLRTPAESSGLTVKDGITLTVSTLALLIAAARFYMSAVLQVDDLRVILIDTPGLDLESDKFFVVSPEATIVVINSGNRAAAIVRIGAVILQPFDARYAPGAQDCGGDGGLGQHLLNYDEAPFSIKGPDILSKNIKFGSNAFESGGLPVEVKPDGRITLPVTQQNQRSGQYRARVCVLFRMATPRGASAFQTVSVPVYDVIFTKGRTMEHGCPTIRQCLEAPDPFATPREHFFGE